MKTNSRLFKIAGVFLCALLLITFSSLVIAECSHECLDSDCVICATINETKNSLASNDTVSVNSTLSLGCLLVCVIIAGLFDKNDTPVNLKVKLSL